MSSEESYYEKTQRQKQLEAYNDGFTIGLIIGGFSGGIGMLAGVLLALAFI